MQRKKLTCAASAFGAIKTRFLLLQKTFRKGSIAEELGHLSLCIILTNALPVQELS